MGAVRQSCCRSSKTLECPLLARPKKVQDMNRTSSTLDVAFLSSEQYFVSKMAVSPVPFFWHRRSARNMFWRAEGGDIDQWLASPLWLGCWRGSSASVSGRRVQNAMGQQGTNCTATYAIVFTTALSQQETQAASVCLPETSKTKIGSGSCFAAA